MEYYPDLIFVSLLVFIIYWGTFKSYLDIVIMNKLFWAVWYVCFAGLIWIVKAVYGVLMMSMNMLMI